MAPDAADTDPEQQPLLPSTNNPQDAEPVAQQKPWWKQKRALLGGVGLVFAFDLLISAILSLYLLITRLHWDTVLRYPNETISWKPCGDISGQPLECSTLETPMDHFNASRSGDFTVNIPLIRLRGTAKATHNVLLNPGGPGGSGVNFLRREGVNLQTVLGKDNFHLVGFDPRGIGASSPPAVCFADAHTRRTHQVRLEGDNEKDAARYDEMGNYARACAEHMGEYAEHVNTPQTAADMNSILDALGQDGLYYMGYSYGTTLGATYATMFPERAERVLIDGVMDTFTYYNSLSADGFCQDADNAFAAFFDECVKDGNDCKLSAFGQTGRDIQNNVTTFLKQLQNDGPMPVYINSTVFGTISHASLTGGIFSSLYKSKLWYGLADGLAQLLSGDPAAAFLAYGDRDPSNDGNDVMREQGSFVMHNDRPSGHPVWPDDPYEVFKIMATSVKNCGQWQTDNGTSAMLEAQWQVPKAHDFKPRRGVETRHPLLVMSSTYDPRCPLAMAKTVRASFNGAKLVEVAGTGHCASSVPSTCAARLVRAYMANGTMPEEDHTKCDSDGVPYFVNPEEKKDGKKGNVAAFSDEDAELMAALRDLSGAIPAPHFAGLPF